jgi:hypothetical protein
MCRVLYLQKPRVVIVMSDKVSTLYARGWFRPLSRPVAQRFLAMDGDDYDLVQRLKKDLARDTMIGKNVEVREDVVEVEEYDDVVFDPEIEDEVEVLDEDDYKPEDNAGGDDADDSGVVEEEEDEEKDHNDDDDDDDDGDIIWDQEVAGGDYIRQSGQILADGEDLVVVTQLHPGFFAYNPVWQRMLIDIYILEAVLAEVTIWIAHETADADEHRGEDNVKTKAERIRARVIEVVDDIGLASVLEERKETLR